jgi:hypothetical protein
MVSQSAQQLSRYVYNPRNLRYQDRQTGRFVSERFIRSTVDSIIATESAKMRTIGEQFQSGAINFAEWQLQSAALLKTLHSSMGAAANGGINNMSNADLGFLGTRIKKQYEYLRKLTNDIRSGKQPLDAKFLNRCASYPEAARNTYERMRERAAKKSDLTEQKSVLSGGESCKGANSCIGEAAKGWVRIGGLVPIGQRKCLTRCKCRMLYR